MASKALAKQVVSARLARIQEELKPIAWGLNDPKQAAEDQLQALVDRDQQRADDEEARLGAIDERNRE